MHYEQIRHRTRAWLFHFFGNEQRAFDEYSIAFRFGADVKIARNLGFIATHKKLLNEGVYWFSEATKLDPNNAETWFNLGFAFERNGKPQGDAAGKKANGGSKLHTDRANQNTL